MDGDAKIILGALLASSLCQLLLVTLDLGEALGWWL